MRWFLLACASLAVDSSARAADWPQWLGPNRDGTSSEIVKPWTGEPKVLWRTEVGEGHSSPIIAKGLVYLFDKVPNEDVERLSAWTADTGRAIGSTRNGHGPFKSPFGAGPRATPIFANDLVYTLGVTGRLSSQTILASPSGTGRTSSGFTLDALADFKAPNLTFGVSASPLVDDERVYVPVGGKGASMVAFDRKTGKVLWQILDDPACYASPIVFGRPNQRQLVFLTQQNIVSVSPKDGSVFWKYPFKDLLSESSTTPLQVGDLLIAGSVTLGSVALRLGEQDGKPSITQVWRKPELTCYFSTPVAVGKDHLYMINGILGLKPGVTLRCVETATGKILWQKSNIGKYHAALLRTGDDKLLMLDDGGHLTLIQPDPKEYRELARSKVCGETWAHPALANGRLYLRDNKELLCLQLAP